MFDFIHGNKRVVQIILILIALTFAFWGVESYQMSGLGSDVASVEGSKISQQEFSNAIREQQQALRTQLGGGADASLLESPELRQSVLQQLIEERVLGIGARNAGLVVRDAQLAEVISGIEPFQENGKFSQARYELLLRNQGTTPVNFENRVRQDLARQQLKETLGESTFISNAVLDRLIGISQQQREVSFASFSPADYAAEVKLAPDAAKMYYENNAAEFRIPEQAKVEYVVLSSEALAPQMEVTAAELKKYYEENSAKYRSAEERQASHILIKTDGDEVKAREKAEQLLKEAKQNADAFAKLAKQHSQDPGSAANGGDLGYFGKGVMAKPFEDAVFEMKVGEVKGPVRTDFGFHVIKLNGVKAAVERGLDDAKGSIEQELKRQKAAKKFAELAESFSNIVYEQSDSLKPAADAFKLKVEQSDWVKRGAENPGVLNNPKLLNAIFSSDATKEKRNTEAIEVASGTLVAARVLEYQPSAIKPFEEVKNEISAKLLLQEADKLAEERAKAALRRLRAGEDTNIKWTEPKTVSRTETGELEGGSLKQIFRANVAKLPAYTGADAGNAGFQVIKISAVKDSGKLDESKREQLVRELTRLKGDAQLTAYLASLREDVDIRIKRENFEKTQ
jgi:peptidyl-prolyl cis-trans isomerase D